MATDKTQHLQTMTSTTFFTILAIFGLLFGALRIMRMIQMTVVLMNNPLASPKSIYYIKNFIGLTVGIASIYYLFVR